MLVKHFTSIRQSAPSGLYFCQKTLGFFLCSARAKLGSRPVGTALKEIGCSAPAAALQRHSVPSQNPPSVLAELGTGGWLPEGPRSWKALGMRAEMLSFGTAVGGIPLDVTNSLHLKQGAGISIMRTFLIINVLVRKWENDTEGTAAAHPCPACPQPCTQSSPYPPFSQDLGKQHEEKGEEGGELAFKIAAKSSSAKCDWKYKRYSWQLTLLCWNNETRVVEAGYLKWALLVFFIRDWVGEQGRAALPRALFLSLDSFFVLEIFSQGAKEDRRAPSHSGVGRGGWSSAYQGKCVRSKCDCLKIIENNFVREVRFNCREGFKLKLEGI